MASGTQAGKRRKLKSTLGALELTTGQAQKLSVSPYRQLSPHLENCCLRLSTNVSYQRAEQDVAYLTGIRVPAKTQQRLVHYQGTNPGFPERLSLLSPATNLSYAKSTRLTTFCKTCD